MKISFCGITQYKDFIVKHLDSSLTVISDNDGKNADILYWIFGPGPDLLNYYSHWFQPSKLIIIHWIGSDVQYLEQKLHGKFFRKRVYYKLWLSVNKLKQKNSTLFHFASAKWLVDELCDLGVKALYLPISSVKEDFLNNEVNNIEREYDFYSYLPFNSMSTYSGDLILSAASKLINRRFALVMKDLSSDEIKQLNYGPNISVLPKLSHQEIFNVYRKSKCMLRFTGTMDYH